MPSAQSRRLAAEALRRAELWLNRDRLELAETEAARAVAFAPTDARSIALHAWIRALASIPPLLAYLRASFGASDSAVAI
jgi:hypothetical protein